MGHRPPSRRKHGQTLTVRFPPFTGEMSEGQRGLYQSIKWTKKSAKKKPACADTSSRACRPISQRQSAER